MKTVVVKPKKHDGGSRTSASMKIIRIMKTIVWNMKQYLTKQQTEELIKLGMPLPDRAELKDQEDPIKEAEYYPVIFDDDGWPELYQFYDIGELMEMLPKSIKNIYGNNNLNIFFARNYWHIVYLNHHTNYEFRRVSGQELIDALYQMIVLLKHETILG